MSAIISFILSPIIPLNVNDDEEPLGIDFVKPLTLFFAFGIWLVYERYQKMHNSPVPFEIQELKAASPDYQSHSIKNPHLESHLDDPNIRSPYFLPDRRYITCYDPATGLHLETIIADNEREIENKIALARNAQKSWKNTTFQQRRRVMRSLLKWLVDNQDTCARVACRDSGKTLIDAALGEILTTCSKLEWLINHGERYLRPEKRSGNMMLSYKQAEVHYEPLGVVAGIVSWNYPLHNAWSPILAGIFAGNGVVLKCSENVIWSTSWFVGAITECLRVCGHDPDIVQLVCCWPEQADALTKSPHIKHITFIGSEVVGRKIAVAATEHLTPVTLELGGKDPAIVLPNTDLSKCASIIMRGVFQNAGQNCIGIERVLVHQDQYDELWEIIAPKIAAIRPGSVLAPSTENYIPTVEMGSMINQTRFASLEVIIEDANENGAHVEGGVTYKHAYLENGTYFSPTLVGPVDPSMKIAREELFAPICLLMPYETVEEAIEIANGTPYGLGASVFGPDQREALEVAKELECGMVSINDFGVFYVNQDLPFGGTKKSGYGRFGGPEGLRSLCNIKAVVTDLWPTWPFWAYTRIPTVLDYPLKSLGKSFAFTNGLIQFLYGYGWRARIRGLMALLGANKA